MKQSNNERIELLEQQVATLTERLTSLEGRLPPPINPDQDFIDDLDTMSRWLLDNGKITLEEIKSNMEKD